MVNKSISLEKNLDVELSQGYRQKNIRNFQLIEQFSNNLLNLMNTHNTGAHAHNSKNIDYSHRQTVTQRLDWLLELVDNIVVGNNGDGIIEVSDARVTSDGQRKETLRQRVDYEVDKLSRLASYENDGLMTKEDRIELDSYVTINPLLLAESTKIGQDIAPLIQRAIDSVGINGATILIPNGDYKWGQTVNLVSNIKIQFGTQARITKTFNGDLFFGASNGQGYEAGVKNVTIEGGRFIGNLEKGYYLISTLHHASFVTIRHVVFYQTSTSHTFDLLGCENIFFEGCAFIGFKLTTNSNHKEAIQLDHSYRQGAGNKDDISSYDGLPTRKVTINECKFLPIKDSKGKVVYPAPNITGQHRSIIGQTPSWITITNNVMRDGVGMATTNEWLGGWIHFRAVKHLVITGNEFTGFNTKGAARVIQLYRTTSNLMMEDITLSAPTVTLSVPEPLDNVVIKDNTFKNFKSTTDKSLINVNGTKFEGNDYFCRFIEITGNNFEGNVPVDSVNANNVGQKLITFKLVRHSSVNQNTSRKCKTFIDVSNSNSISINGNNFENMKHTCILVSSASNEGINRMISITDNKAVKGTTFLWFDRTDGITIRGNQVYDFIGKGTTGLTSAMVGRDEMYKVVIANNTIDVNDKDYIGIRLTGTKSNGIVQGNMVGNTLNPIRIISGAFILEKDNLVWD